MLCPLQILTILFFFQPERNCTHSPFQKFNNKVVFDLGRAVLTSFHLIKTLSSFRFTVSLTRIGRVNGDVSLRGKLSPFEAQLRRELEERGNGGAPLIND